ncbi:MAG: hypothetical protein A07HR60_00141 [uncultured archaeon A07HR60]|jgi:hypothetical protein|nr:MAG: hypothetical protein J07HR59_00654 [Halorubrum sp. J07HR59]ESS12907.1 MAG: hypothetical protein A07HR60_00141 [uncultured archaeon A07HR60]
MGDTVDSETDGDLTDDTDRTVVSLGGDGLPGSAGQAELELPPDATPDETAAITSVVAAHLRDRAVAAAAITDSEPTWEDSQWQFAGRLAGLDRLPARVTDGAPTDEWTAASRADRF